jgi:predicted metalloprotease with PDZ domain
MGSGQNVSTSPEEAQMATTVLPPYLDARVSMLAASAKKVIKRAATEARAIVNPTVDGRETPFLSFEEQIAACQRMREIRLSNDINALEITLTNREGGNGVVVSSIGPGTALAAGILVGDVIISVNGNGVHNHEQAMNLMRSTTCRELALTMDGKPRQVLIDKSEAGKLDITLSSSKDGRRVEVSEVKLLGLASRAGIEVGETILSVNGALVTDHAQAIALMDSSERFVEIVIAEPKPDRSARGVYESMLIGV